MKAKAQAEDGWRRRLHMRLMPRPHLSETPAAREEAWKLPQDAQFAAAPPARRLRQAGPRAVTPWHRPWHATDPVGTTPSTPPRRPASRSPMTAATAKPRLPAAAVLDRSAAIVGCLADSPRFP